MSFFLNPQWPAPSRVRALITTRKGGCSQAPYDTFNLAAHVGDDVDHVIQNRRDLYQTCGPVGWLDQVHGTRVRKLKAGIPDDAVEGDAAITREIGRVCAVLTADCLPILICHREGGGVAAVHAGWRGLAAGIVTMTIAAFECEPEALLAYLGPAISQAHFEVGEDVRDAFVAAGRERGFSASLASAFIAHPQRKDKFYADLYQLARIELRSLGVKAIFGGEYCTYRDTERFYSYRRDGITGRFASLIWIDESC